MSFRTNAGSQWSEAPGSGAAAAMAGGYLVETSPGVYEATADRSLATHEFDVVAGVASIVAIGTGASPLRGRKVADNYLFYTA